ncbi:phosphate:sodium symporter [Aureicoccus marinus]|uniref:Phosphate transporter n=2 Tax=Aureicoccus marinus TaxID=754435 RepID=A0A2S7T821_9FLAO|nr:phosphate:sodium symporter [Aureicoccus marinus]
MGEQIYFIMIIALAVLAITDLVVGVSNDAVNFLNSALGSKAIAVRTIMITASIGIALGAMSSAGLMEVARKGIFNPSEFVFAEIILIFMAVMITDVLLLDFFNTLGMPTSTTVSIVFELLGAAVAMAIIKIMNKGDGLDTLSQYINNEQALVIISGILLSVFIAFSIGAIVQFISRLLIGYDSKQENRTAAAVFGGVAITAINYFILVKGLKGTTLIPEELLLFIKEQTVLFIGINVVIWSFLSLLFTYLFRWNIYRIIITLGTFALAMAFAGNDLVNFIGVPIAALESYEAWQASGVAANEFSMEGLASKVSTDPMLLIAAGLIMIITLWLSTKARYVTETEINLAREGEGEERFQPNFLSRQIVKFVLVGFDSVSKVFPASVRNTVSHRLAKPTVTVPKNRRQDLPAFDMIRASVNMMVASVLISIATSMKLPLSTTYVTFMVAMGTSLADRAWGAESAVYRVAGVLNVIAGWFMTALIAFVSAGVIATLLYYGGTIALVLLLFCAAVLLGRNFIKHKKSRQDNVAEDKLRRAESGSIQGVIEESAKTISKVIKRSNRIYTAAVDGLAKHDLEELKKANKDVVKLTKEIDGLKDQLFYFIKNLDEASVEPASNFYINLLGYLQDFAQSLEYIAKLGHTHVLNNHKKLKYNQIKDLQELDQMLETLFHDTSSIFESKSFDRILPMLNKKEEYLKAIEEKIEQQVARTRTEESSPKNTTLYFSLLGESKDMIEAAMDLLELYYSEHDSTVEPIRIDKPEDE